MQLIGLLNKKEILRIGITGPRAGSQSGETTGLEEEARPGGERKAQPEGSADHRVGMTKMNVALDSHRLRCPGRESCCPRSLEKDQVGSLGHSFGLFLEKNICIYLFGYARS